jgi:8-oxo-dGTP diphosphatase
MSLSPPDNKAPIRVAVAVVERDGVFLIGQRPEGVPLSGLWEFPGGKMRGGEMAEDAAVRECIEETGQTVVAVGRYSTVVEQYAHGLVEITFIACRPADVLAAPQAPFRWVAAAELGNYSFPSANAKLIRQLVAEAAAG